LQWDTVETRHHTVPDRACTPEPEKVEEEEAGEAEEEGAVQQHEQWEQGALVALSSMDRPVHALCGRVGRQQTA